MRQLGLTGSIGSGKSTVADRFAALGAAVIDADRLAREATEDPEVQRRIADALGAELIVGGRLDRDRTAARVFRDPEARGALEAIVHPAVARARAERVRALREGERPPPLVVHDIPLLFESGLDGAFDATAVVAAPLDVRVRRAVARGMSAEDVRRRDAAQMPQDEKARRATWVIDNGGPPDALDAQVARIWRALIGARG